MKWFRWLLDEFCPHFWEDAPFVAGLSDDYYIKYDIIEVCKLCGLKGRIVGVTYR